MGHCQTGISNPSQQDDVDVNNAVVAKKSQKAVYEKLRRDKLNEHFQDLGNVIDSDRHKNDKASIVISTIQALKDLISEVSRLQSEHAALSQESNELTLENNELREEKTSLRSDIGTLEVQYHQTRFIPPWPPIDPSVGTTRPFSYPVALSVPSRPFPMCSPPLQPMPFFGNQSAVPSDPGPMIILYPTPATPYINQPSTLNASSSYICSKEVCENGSSSQDTIDSGEKSNDFPDVITDLELKMPGSIAQKLLPGEKGKQLPMGQVKYLNRCPSSKGSQTPLLTYEMIFRNLFILKLLAACFFLVIYSK